jgi:hypothetical protein
MIDYQPPQQPAQPPTPPPLTNQQKTDWNSFLDFTDKEGYKGNPILDDRSKQLGQYLMQKYRTLNPKATITYDDVPRVQQSLQDYRNQVVQKWRADHSVMPVKSEDEIIPGLSDVDGWLGSKTSSHKFPVGGITNTDGSIQQYGTNTAAYDAAIAKINKGKK